jgi:acetate kinase
VVEPIGEKGKLSLRESGGSNVNEDLAVKDHGDAAQKILSRIDSALRDVHVVGHRVVHGADRYSAPVAVDDEVIRTIEELEDLAPLHNASAVSVIRACRAALGERIPEVAVFDTAFHRTIPDRARLYAIPWALTERYGIQRYGFHGISHNYLMLRYAELSGTPVDRTNIITLHLEGGSSATAIAGGKSVDTSMGFTPLEGLIMGTRSGDIDPALVSFLARKENVDAGEVEKWLNKKSGLLGISGRSQDTRDLVQQQADAERSRLALEMFAYRVRKYVGAYLAAMGRAAAVVFGGGISENTPEVRQRICEGLEWFGLDFDADRNAGVIDREGEITRDGTRLRAFVIPSEEGLMIAHEALRCGRSDSDR